MRQALGKSIDDLISDNQNAEITLACEGFCSWRKFSIRQTGRKNNAQQQRLDELTNEMIILAGSLDTCVASESITGIVRWTNELHRLLADKELPNDTED